MGQFDAVFGPYGADFINANVISVALATEEPISHLRLRSAITQLRQRHPSLRMRLTTLASVTDCRQIIDDSDDQDYGFVQVHGQSHEDEAPARMNEYLAELVRGLDVVEGRTWGVVHLRTRSVNYLVFTFSHVIADLLSVTLLVREFIRIYNEGGAHGSTNDTYEEYLTEIAAAWRSSVSPHVAWWLQQPWTDLPAMPGLHTRSRSTEASQRHHTDVLPRAGRTARLTDTDVIGAVGQSLRDVAGLPHTRIDVSTHGRLTRSRRSAIGWISRAVPYFIDWGKGRSRADVDQLLIALKDRERTWDAAFPAIRQLAEVPIENQFGAHAFVNFFGSFDPTRYALKQFSVSPIQPFFSPPRRSSFTPLHLTVRRTPDSWLLSWRFHEDFDDKDIPAAVAARTAEILDGN
ncbi:condensation domain-containing protein [Streptomyces sp. NPDC058067]|uniref:condensation domain-containing protein n=1 Tax=Streptomyces sp. NPDC058067 TaxID=3346324 RepID=UPI0036E63E89